MEYELVKQLVTRAIPDIAVGEISYISEGGDSLTFEVNETYIFKFPISDASSEGIMREAYILDFLKHRLPHYVPRLVAKVQAPTVFPYPFTVQQKLKGFSGETTRPLSSNWASIASTIGGILSKLHSCDSSQVSNMVPTKSIPTPEVMLTRALQYRELIRGVIAQDALVERYLIGDMPLPSETGRRYVLSHGDIKGEHVFITDDKSGVSGIVDWADTCLTDPITDFMGFMIWLGPRFTEQILKSYSLDTDADFLNRIVFYSRCHALINLGENLAGETDSPRDLVLRQLKWAFSG